MRFFKDFPEAMSEIKRDMSEMGVEVKTKTVQDKDITGTDEYDTVELMNYAYTVIQPRFEDLTPTQPWADAEWEERLAGLNGSPVNPGEAYKLWRDEKHSWEDFLEDVHGVPLARTHYERETYDPNRVRFAYSYPERLHVSAQVRHVIKRLREDPFSRQCYVSIWRPDMDALRFGNRRVPCSLGYHFMFRENRLHITYSMRSCELGTFFPNDQFFALKLLHHVADETDLSTGRFSHFINSFHCYKKTMGYVF